MQLAVPCAAEPPSTTTKTSRAELEQPWPQLCNGLGSVSTASFLISVLRQTMTDSHFQILALYMTLPSPLRISFQSWHRSLGVSQHSELRGPTLHWTVLMTERTAGPPTVEPRLWRVMLKLLFWYHLGSKGSLCLRCSDYPENYAWLAGRKVQHLWWL